MRTLGYEACFSLARSEKFIHWTARVLPGAGFGLAAEATRRRIE